MAKLQIKGRLQYIPGPWGMNEPVKSARIKIIDKDIGGADDTILVRDTNSLGKFSGTSRDWQDKRKIRYWNPLPPPGRWETKTVPDLSDILMLEIDITDGSHHFRGPFVFLGDNVEVPIVVPWGKEIPTIPVNVKVNGAACTDGEDLQKKARAAFENGTSPVRIELRGPDALPFMPFAGKSLNQLKEMVDDIMPGAKKMFYENPTGAEELLAIAVVILAVGAASAVTVLATAVAFSLILALVLGYSDINLKVLNADGQNPLPGIEFELRKA